MSELVINGSNIGSELTQLLMCDSIEPGSDASYAMCKIIYEYHPLGKKMVDTPIKKAQSRKREISIAASPGTRVKEAFERQWVADGLDETIANVAQLARMYGIGALALVIDGVESDAPLDLSKLPGAKISFNSLDPLNTAGSLVLNQDPNSVDFQKPGAIAVQGKNYHPSR
ncbi:MAG: DUF1073 domain-containing protein, partial [Alphaproteobacteria bacterium]|nr:DUF1073 domain-containing protein [Alphaproteobacteria bacterium]